ncbi:MAG: gliding motility-associated C-terminal domain-containing protein [Bacteroidota bacterium]
MKKTSRLLLVSFCLSVISITHIFAQTPCNQRLISDADFSYSGGGAEPARWNLNQAKANGVNIDQAAFTYLPAGNFSNTQTEANPGFAKNTTRQYAVVKNPQDLNPQYANIPSDGMVVINPLQGEQEQFAQFQINGLIPNNEYFIEIKVYNVLNYTPTNGCCWNQMLKAENVGNANNPHDGNNNDGTSTSTNGNFNWDMGGNFIQTVPRPNAGGTFMILKGKKYLGSATTGFTITFSQGANTNYRENAFVFAIDYIKVYGCQQEAINVSGGSPLVCEATEVTLTAQGLGPQGSSYSWYKNGTLLPGENKDVLNIVSALIPTTGPNVPDTYRAVGLWAAKDQPITSKLCCSSVGGTYDEVARQSFDGLTYTCTNRANGYADIPNKGINIIDPSYVYAGTTCNSLNDGQYAVVQSSYAGDFWRSPKPEVKDHTGVTGSGALFINAKGNVGSVFYKFDLSADLCPDTRYEFSVWYASLANGPETKPDIRFDVLNGSTTIESTSTGIIPENFKWYQSTVTFVTPAIGNPVYTLQVVNLVGDVGPGNDLMIDDIVVKKCTPFINLYQNGTKDSVVSVCNNNPVDLKVTTFYDLEDYITNNPTGTVYYQWMKATSPNAPDGTWTLIGTPETTGTLSVVPTATTTYYRAKVSADQARAATGLAPLAKDCGNDGLTTYFKLTKGGNFSIPPASGTTAYCVGDAMTLNGNAGTGVQWEWRKGTTFGGATVLTGYGYSNDVAKKNYSRTFATGDDGTYYFVVKDAGGCETYDDIVVTANPVLTITPAAKAADVCVKTTSQTSTLTYTATGSPTNYTITWNAAGITAGLVNVATTALPASPISISIPANTAANTYTGTITVTKTGGCPSTGVNFTLTINTPPSPTFTVEPTLPLCVNGSATYTTQASQSGYTWVIPGTAGTDYTITSGGITTNTITLTWKTSGSKLVTVNYSNGTCIGATPASNTITVNALPTPTWIAQPTNGTSVCVDAGNVTYRTQAGQSDYVWSVPGTAGTDYSITSGGTGSTSSEITLVWKTAGSKIVTVGYTTGSCVSTTPATNTITVVALPTPSFINAPSDVCINNSVIYTTQASQSSYTWTVPGVLNTDYTVTGGSLGTSSNTATITWKSTGSKTVTVNYSNGTCTGATAASSIININDVGAPIISCGTSTNNSVEFNWSPMSGATSYTISHTTNGGATINDPATPSSTFSVSSLNPGDEVIITVTPTGGPSTCFKAASFKCTATSCPALPPHAPTADITICNNGSVTYTETASTGGTITWTNSNTAIGLAASGSGTGNTLTLNFTATNTTASPISAKIRTITTYGPCSYPDSFNIIVNPAAVVTLTSAAPTIGQTFCINKPITSITYSITGTGNNATVSGLPDGVTGTYASGVFTISGAPTQSGTFNYTVTGTGTCSNGTATGTINVTGLPVISSITPTDPLTCGGSNGSFTINGLAPTASYTVNFIADGVTQSPQVLSANALGSIVVGSLKQGGYSGITVTLSTADCASTEATTTLSDPSVFTPVASSNVPCVGSPLNLSTTTSSDPSATYTWTGPNGYTASGATPTLPSATTSMDGDYIVKATVLGCASSDNVTVKINTPPLAPSVNGTPICGSGTITLTATRSGAATDVLKWYSDAALSTEIATGTSYTTPTLTNSTDYYVTETDLSTCTSAATKVTATINTVPSAPIAGTPVSRCGTGSVTVNASASGAGTNILKWYSNAGLTTQVSTGNSYVTPSITTTTNYYVTETTVAGCVSTSATTVTATVNQTPSAPIVSNIGYCQNAVAVPVTASGNNLMWYTLGGSTSVAPTPVTTEPRTITYYVTSSNGTCESEQFPLIVTVKPISAYAGGPIIRVDEGVSTQIKGTATGNGMIVSWTPSLYLSSSSIPNPRIAALDDGTYTMTVTSNDGCVATDNLQVIVLRTLKIPNVFSPNGDGINDTWNIEYLEDYVNAKVSIFNRYGQFMFEAAAGSYNGKPWDGTNKGTPLPVGTYFYIINLGEGKDPISGSISIIR